MKKKTPRVNSRVEPAMALGAFQFPRGPFAHSATWCTRNLQAVKIAAKFIGIWPLTRTFRFAPREGMYITLLMCTGLTFGSICALFGLTNGIIDQRQYTILVTAVIASAVVPTINALTPPAAWGCRGSSLNRPPARS